MNQKRMKAENKKKIFDTISEYPGISRVNIAERCRFSKTTVSMLVDELIRDGYVRDGGLVTSSTAASGRKPNSLYLNRMNYCIVVVNWHKRYLQIARVDLSCSIRSLRVLSAQQEDIQAVLAGEVKRFIETECESCSVTAVCFILPAIIDDAGGEIISAVLTAEQTDRLIPRMREELRGYSLAFFNDTACMAYAERQLDGKGSQDDFVYVNMNDGIGAAFVMDGKLLGGASGIVTQFGHFSLGRKGDACICGGHGCLETRVGEQALAKRIEECRAGESFRGSQPVLFRDVGILAAEGNADALRVEDALAADLGYALGNLVTMLRVKRILLGGFGRNLGSYFLEKVRESVTGVGFQMFVQQAKIEYATLDEEALLGGAARYYMDNYFELSETAEEQFG